MTFDLKEFLRDSLYYPSSGTDGGVIKYCNKHYAELGIDSFVYADYAYDEERFRQRVCGIRGYLVDDDIRLSIGDLLPKDEMFMPSSINADEYNKYQKDLTPFARLFILKRDPEFGEEHGPERFKLLFMGFEGVAAYSGLYLSNGIAPKALAIIQPGLSFGLNWTDYEDPQAPLAEVVMKSEAVPEYVFYGGRRAGDYEHFSWPGYSKVKRVHHYESDEYSGEVTIWLHH